MFRKKRIIVKSRHKFPSDFFTENSDFLLMHKEQASVEHDLDILDVKRTNSTDCSNIMPKETPKFIHNLSAFSRVKSRDETYANQINLQDNQSRHTRTKSYTTKTGSSGIRSCLPSQDSKAIQISESNRPHHPQSETGQCTK